MEEPVKRGRGRPRVTDAALRRIRLNVTIPLGVDMAINLATDKAGISKSRWMEAAFMAKLKAKPRREKRHTSLAQGA